MSDEFTLTLNSPITEEQWDMIADVDFDHTNEITFHTKHGKEVKFVKADAQPERKTGKWIWDENGMDWGLGAWRCSECGIKPETWWANSKNLNPLRCSGGNFCGICGVDMRGEE